MTVHKTDPHSLSLKELQQYFHLPITDAAERLGICTTVLKKICRNNGVKRWPQRKIASINKMIEALQQLIDEQDGDIPKLNMDMEELLAKKKFLLENPNTSYKSVVSKYAINSFHSKIEKEKEKVNQKSPPNSYGHQLPSLYTETKSPTQLYHMGDKSQIPRIPRIQTLEDKKPIFSLPGPSKLIVKKPTESNKMPNILNLSTENMHTAAAALASLASGSTTSASNCGNQQATFSTSEGHPRPHRLTDILNEVQYSRVPIFNHLRPDHASRFSNPLRMSG